MPSVISGDANVSATEFGFLDGVTSSLQSQIDGKPAAPTAWSSYTPALTATTTNPTLGTGSLAEGQYLKIGKLVFVQGYIKFGTSGVNAGSGTYQISLPSAVSEGITGQVYSHGSVWLFDANTTASRLGGYSVASGNSYFTIVYMATSADNVFANATNVFPWTWAAQDQIGFNFWYLEQ